MNNKIAFLETGSVGALTYSKSSFYTGTLLEELYMKKLDKIKSLGLVFHQSHSMFFTSNQKVMSREI